ncbi:hypothetical protein [Ferrimicrobium sp.]|uniref:hypothetical protein n=1 Tax=Ferrimicrobium sp. TaxID=2926050 RepID=UPI002639DE96|nr:hypothetical protein [Ferrimicrobium sp.]
MSQPDMVEISTSERAPLFWAEPVNPVELALDRPAELTGRRLAQGQLNGRPGPDQGYALALYEHLAGQVQALPTEQRADIQAGVVACAMAIAGRLGRAPILADLKVVLEHFGYLGGATSEQIRIRQDRFKGIAHNYQALRRMVAFTEMELNLQE